MAKILQLLPPKAEQPKKTMTAHDNGEKLEILMEDGERIVAKSRRSGRWFLLRKRLDGGWSSVGDV